jgi:hypothetical protein
MMPTADRSRPRLLLAGVGAVAVAIVVVVAGLTASGKGTSGPSGSAAPAAAEPSDRAELAFGAGIPAIDPAPWTAVDWRQVPNAFGKDPVPGLDRIDGLIAGGPGLIGWGRTRWNGRNQFNDMGAIYLSSNGVDWVVVPLAAGVGQADASEFSLLAPGPAGIVVLGNVCCTNEGQPALWRSADGRAWDRLAYPDAIGPAELTDLIATGDRYVVTGRLNGVAAMWTSSDGATWTAVDGREAGFGPGLISDVARTPNGLVAAGHLDVKGTYDGAVWTSPDGENWTRVAAEPLAGDDDSLVSRIVPWAGGWFLIGRDGPHAERVRCDQMGQNGHLASIAEPVIPDPVDSDLTCGWGREVQWLTADGTAWQRVVPAGQGGGLARPGELIEFRLVSAGGPGLVVIGEGAEVGAASVFVSADGVTWRRTPPPKQFPVGIVPYGFVIGGRMIAAVADGPSAWIGTVR